MKTLLTTPISGRFKAFEAFAKSLDNINVRGNWQHHYAHKQHGDDFKAIGNESHRKGNAVNQNKKEPFRCR